MPVVLENIKRQITEELAEEFVTFTERLNSRHCNRNLLPDVLHDGHRN